MRKLFLLGLGLVFACATVSAQMHNNATEKKVSDTIVFASDVMVGSTLLKAGEYKISCDTKKMTFTLLVPGKDIERLATLDPATRAQVVGDGKKVLDVFCKGAHMD